jgi:outer membrane receptor for ferric coprogen and ferric-rhodotorulic acid
VAKTIDPGIEPPYTDEVLIGYATPMAGLWSVDAFFQYRDSKQFIEDIPTVLPNSSYVYRNDPNAQRRYRALTLELNRRLANRWSTSISYSLSKLYGNYDQDYSSAAAVFNTSSLINDGPGSFTADTFRQGVLSQDRTHVFKIFGSYMPLDQLTLGTYIRGQSGTPWEARGLPWGSTATYLRYLEPAGTNRNDFWTNVDLLAAYAIPFGRARFKVEGRILNLFDTQTALTVDQRQYLDGRIRTIVGTPPADCLACWTDAMVQGTTTPNPAFGQPTSYAPARRFLLSLIADF